MLRTDDEVDLRTEFERKKLMAHEVVHLDSFNNAKFRRALSQGASESDWDRTWGGTHPLLFVFLTYRLANRLFVLLLEAFLGTLILFNAGIPYRGDVVVIINSNVIQDVIVLSCLAFAFAFRFRGSMLRLVFVIEPRPLRTRSTRLVVILLVIAI